MSQDDVMLAHNKPLEFTSDLIRWPMYASKKLDGIRCLIWGGRLLTRSLKPQPNQNLKEHLRPLIDTCLRQGIVLEGELYSHSHTFAEHSSILRSKDKPVPKGMQFMIFDGMPFEQWNSCPLEFFERMDVVQSKILYSEWWDHVEQFQVFDAEDAQNHLDFWLSEGYEGLMLRSPRGLYKHGRTTAREGTFFKFKQWTQSQATIIGFTSRREMVEGASGSRGLTPTGKLERIHQKHLFQPTDAIGAVVLSSTNETENIQFKATFARGHKPETFGLTWENHQDFIGLKAKFRYQPQGTKNLPRMARIYEIETTLGAASK